MGSVMSKKSFLIFFLWRCPKLSTYISVFQHQLHEVVIDTVMCCPHLPSNMKNLFHGYWECCQLIALSSQSPSGIDLAKKKKKTFKVQLGKPTCNAWTMQGKPGPLVLSREAMKSSPRHQLKFSLRLGSQLLHQPSPLLSTDIDTKSTF